MVMMIGLRPRRLLIVSLLTWMAIAIPILTYLLWHPAELNSLRGRDLFITLGPAMGTQIVLILFFNRLQDLVDRLYHERVQYYEQIIERQTIRQQAMEQAVSQIHNGPLQSLALLMRDLDQDQMRSPVLRQRLADLNAEIRAVGHSLTDSSVPHSDLLPLPPDHLLRLGEGTCVDLNHPLHHLLYEVYRLTLKRHLPYFQTIKVKVRNFAPLESSELSFELKRDLCLWLEEALCNVGKHAQGTTRLVVTGQYDADQYVLQVQDNGIGCNGIGCNEVVCNPDLEQQGTKFCTLLAQRLGGTFQRTSLPTGGVLCQLAWCCGLKKLDSIDRISETEGMA